jgi:GTP 3',8-cyclase
MPVSNEGDWGPGLPSPGHRHVPVAEMQAIIKTALKTDLQPAHAPSGNGPAVVLRLPDARGTLGFISPVSQHFCPTCNRLRLTADGKLRPCLLDEGEVDVRAALRSGASDEHLRALIAQAVSFKPERHHLDQSIVPLDRVMAQIGG